MTPELVLYNAATKTVVVIFQEHGDTFEPSLTFNDGIIKVFDHGVLVRKYDLRQSWWKRVFG